MVSVVVWAWSQATRGLHGAEVHMASLATLGSVSPWLQSGGPARSSGAVGGDAQGRGRAALWGSAQLGPFRDFPRPRSGHHPPCAGPQNLRAVSEQSVLQEFRPAVHCGAGHTASHSPTDRFTLWS